MGRATLALLAAGMLFAAARVAAGDDTVTLSVKPVLCITDQHSASCDLSFLVLWEARRAGRYCLYSDFSATPLDCWMQAVAGRFAEDRVVDASFRYWLTAGAGEERVAEATIEVMSMATSDRRRNRRNRHVWSIL